MRDEYEVPSDATEKKKSRDNLTILDLIGVTIVCATIIALCWILFG